MWHHCSLLVHCEGVGSWWILASPRWKSPWHFSSETSHWCHSFISNMNSKKIMDPRNLTSHAASSQEFFFPIIQIWLFFCMAWQYLKRLHHAILQVLERFALLLCIAVIWAFAAILTVAGAYNTAKSQTQFETTCNGWNLITKAAHFLKF